MYRNLDTFKDYIYKRNMAFESKVLGGENPLGNLHFCNNQKYLDAFSQDIIYGNLHTDSIQESIYNTLTHRVILDKQFCKDNSDEFGVFRIKDHKELCEKVNEHLKHHNMKGRYRNVLSNRHLKINQGVDMFDRIISETLPVLESFNNCTQEDIWYDEKLDNCYNVGPFNKYQFTSDMLYIDELNIIPSVVNYCNLGTERGFWYLTDQWKNFDTDIINLGIKYNSEYDHKTEYTKYLIPTDVTNILCELYKYTMSKQKRYRRKEVITHGKSLIIPKNIQEYVLGEK